jgi:hypothetical protein
MSHFPPRVPIILLLSLSFLVACEKPNTEMEKAGEFQLSFAALKDSAHLGVYRFRTSVYVEAYVISSDAAGQFFGKIVLQENSNDKAMGLLLSTDLFETALWYPEGQKVRLHLKDLYVDQKTLGLSVGSVFSSFGNLSIGRLPLLNTQESLEFIAGETMVIAPKKRTPLGLTDIDLQTLVQIDSLRIGPESQGLNFADYKEDSLRVFYDKDGSKVYLNSSGYADFWDTQLPEHWVSIKGVLTKVRTKYELEIRDLSDIKINL